MNKFLNKIIKDPDVNILLNSIYDGIYIVNREREILFWNEGAERITGYSKEEVLNKKCADNILNHIDENGNNLCSSHCPLMESMLYDKRTEAKIYPLSKDNKKFPVSTRVSPIKDSGGNIIGAIEIFRDISKEEELRVLQDKFNDLIKKYISKTTYHEVVKQAEKGICESAQIRDLTILYVDIVEFTAFAENNSMEETAEMLNEIFRFCGSIIKENHGDIDKFIGDSIMAVFVDANDAVIASEKILQGIFLINDRRLKKGKEKISLHIGINSGTVMQVGIGTSERKDFTIIGDAVNIASRIEELSSPDAIFISESTYSRLRNHASFAFFDKMWVKGRKEPILIFKSI